ncbi:MAG: hypothetical protein JW712_09985 [Dehalococcoidales bacterium]|nr:hypothetical protein [Dehalococcoidales bacterium]
MSYPVSLSIDYPESHSRLLLLLKVFFGWLYVGIPHGICMAIYQIVAVIISIIAFFAILFTGKFPGGLFDTYVGYMR